MTKQTKRLIEWIMNLQEATNKLQQIQRCAKGIEYLEKYTQPCQVLTLKQFQPNTEQTIQVPLAQYPRLQTAVLKAVREEINNLKQELKELGITEETECSPQT